MPRASLDLPSTIERSDRHAQEIFSAALRSAVVTYGEGERARRTAFAALKHSYEKVGDHWEPKERRGPSDDQAARRRAARGDTAGGVDARASKRHLLDVAARVGVTGRSRMTKGELVAAIERANERATRRSRERDRR